MRCILTRHVRTSSRRLQRLRMSWTDGRVGAMDRTLNDQVGGFLISERRSVQLPGRRVSARFCDGTRDRQTNLEPGWRTSHGDPYNYG